ncbi:unnamed protein product [Vitrella brassicaformis CCMP3155]|uniref:RING-type domain-containing protein n=2 Tax=Vitrella brassicaformis TaxID=1169539 RepID=A0A0G4GIF7_VITBC|nr:unnamed protein product [Vitrella brassicaformis CCMP3155]|eukprot:CEM29614.1 unnamed protein product [Vitrella brassicaformis CCMP3155]
MDDDTESLSETVPDCLECSICFGLLYKPTALDCGHVFCFWCLFRSMAQWHASKCPLCKRSFSVFPRVCRPLYMYIRSKYPRTFDQRRQEVEEFERATERQSPAEEHILTPGSGANVDRLPPTASREIRDLLSAWQGNDAPQPPLPPSPSRPAAASGAEPMAESGGGQQGEDGAAGEGDEAFVHVSDEVSSLLSPEMRPTAVRLPVREFVHFQVGCDGCGRLPIVGARYRCRDCHERVGYDLCGACHRENYSRCGLFNQMHTSAHRMELVQPDAVTVLLNCLHKCHPTLPLAELLSLLELQGSSGPSTPDNDSDNDLEDETPERTGPLPPLGLMPDEQSPPVGDDETGDRPAPAGGREEGRGGSSA